LFTPITECQAFLSRKRTWVIEKNNNTPKNRYRLMWMDVKYRPGTVKVVAFDDSGKAVTEECVLPANLIQLFECRREKITANGDISFVTVSVVDKMGCSYSDEQLKFKVTGRVFEQYNVMPLP
jgi:beta-galactosidase